MDERLVTKDDIRIGFKHEGEGPAVLLVHMLNATKESWDPFAGKLHDAGFSTMAIDLRGHGESEQTWTTFGKEDFAKMEQDLLAASSFLKKQKVPLGATVGASIGANHALRFSHAHGKLKGTVLLSPGLDYRGVTAQEFIGDTPLLMYASEGDAYSAQSSQTLQATHGTLHLLEGDAHGTRMLNDKIMDDIVSWLQAQ
ncbi:MAG: alpha/beta fold hydrolase [Candidatus Woesearchaeota archaeon]|jgi:alpha-beta hydrolase superfamily lysophospholipase|nr:alpha/beta fold hydrolase [Candidatus Woesearchaeota archaeon]MDP7181205.1 alpha/beta fold hydrolase [Candidatus Woesearchaeota archaeon]MDP7198175.1 alpha/beta fold hydrolase [Candidatus Woesearchaeota archaeon]MDP7467010.1 alpha/beta fold hydrolase [Candidatus Woesearchaeota archaeon]MDP7646680.1 alpha/beta fold hydrolase [Candidatus Woesearchaeota archaeon]